MSAGDAPRRSIRHATNPAMGPDSPMWKPLMRFLLRASLTVIATLVLWSFALQTPMLFLLRLSEEVTLRLANTDSKYPIAEEPSGDWKFRIPVDDSTVEGAGPVKIRSIDFTASRSDMVLFTFGLPLFWAIMFAAQLDKQAVRALVWGSMVIVVAEALVLFVFLQINAYEALTRFHPSPSGLAKWLRDWGSYLIVGVVPFCSPHYRRALFSFPPAAAVF